MTTNRPQSDLVWWRKDEQYFQLGKNSEISFLDKKKNILLLMPFVGSEPTISQSLTGSFHEKGSPHRNHLATEDKLY